MRSSSPLVLLAAAAVALAASPPPTPAPSFDVPRTLLRAPAAPDADPCRDAMLQWFAALDNGTEWAEQMLDAMGRRGTGVAWGNHLWLGAQTQCALAAAPGGGARFSVATVQVEERAAAGWAAGPGSGLPRPRPPAFLGVCAPAACGLAALRAALRLPPSSALLALRHAPDPDFHFFALPALHLLGALLGAAVLLAAAGTAIDVIRRRRARMRSHRYAVCCAPVPAASVTTLVQGSECSPATAVFVEASPTPSAAASDAGPELPEDEPAGLPVRLLLCFSVRANLRKLLDTRVEDSLACLHGMRVFSLVWVIAGHTCMFAFPFSDNKRFRQVVEEDFLFQSIGNGAFSVDTFFFISGLLVSHVFLKVRSREKDAAGSVVKVPPKSGKKSGFLNSIVDFIGVFTYRILRLLPPYFFVMLLAYLVSQWFAHNAVFPTPVGDHVNCPKYWWRNLLFINTLFPVDSMCMIWSWYLANDTQFYTLAIILLLLSKRFPRSAVITLALLVISSWVTTAVIVINTDHTPKVEEPLGLFDALYDKPWMRLGPYAVGMAAGCLLHSPGLKARLNKAVVLSGWAVSMALSFSLVHGLYGSLGRAASAAYVALSHTAWGISVAWVAIACSTGHGGPVSRLLSHPSLYPLSRLTYCAYLAHPVLMLSVLMFMDAPVHLSRGSMSVMIFGYITSSYLLSFVISLLFEAPAIALLNLLHPIRRKVK